MEGIDKILPTSTELVRSTYYSDEDLYDEYMLESLRKTWTEQAENPYRSARSRQEAERLVGRIVFEISYRKEQSLIDLESNDE